MIKYYSIRVLIIIMTDIFGGKNLHNVEAFFSVFLPKICERNVLNNTWDNQQYFIA